MKGHPIPAATLLHDGRERVASLCESLLQCLQAVELLLGGVQWNAER